MDLGFTRPSRREPLAASAWSGSAGLVSMSGLAGTTPAGQIVFLSHAREVANVIGQAGTAGARGL